jgi:transcriptional regulator with XRE-family HTH domain
VSFAGKEKIMFIPTIDMVKTGQNINRLRKLAGISVKDLQDIFGFTTPQAIYKWQHGTALPTVDNLVILAAVLGVSVDEILVVTDVKVFISA